MNCQKLGPEQVGSEDPGAGSWRTYPRQKSGPSLEAGASWMAEDVKGIGEWALPLSHTCSREG